MIRDSLAIYQFRIIICLQPLSNHHRSRTYEIFPGSIDVYMGDGTLKNRVKEMQVMIDSDFLVEAVSLPNHPYCVRVTPSTVQYPTLVIESETQEQQLQWLNEILQEINAASKA